MTRGPQQRARLVWGGYTISVQRGFGSLLFFEVKKLEGDSVIACGHSDEHVSARRFALQLREWWEGELAAELPVRRRAA